MRILWAGSFRETDQLNNGAGVVMRQAYFFMLFCFLGNAIGDVYMLDTDAPPWKCVNVGDGDVFEQLKRIKQKYNGNVANDKIEKTPGGVYSLSAEILHPDMNGYVKHVYFNTEDACNNIVIKNNYDDVHQNQSATENVIRYVSEASMPPASSDSSIEVYERQHQFNAESRPAAVKDVPGVNGGGFSKALPMIFGVLFFPIMLRKWRNKNNRGKQEAVRGVVLGLVGVHIFALSRNFRGNHTKDDYGNCIFYGDKWLKQTDYFINNVLSENRLIRDFLDGGDKCGVNSRCFLREVVDAEVRRHVEMDHVNFGVVDEMQGHDFEYYCAELLAESGWGVAVTKKTGDQGVDIIAEYKDLGVRAVFQCKRSAKKVNNKAVQEIYAGKRREQADIAVVVSNNSYTKSAKDLAYSTGVYLIYYEEINEFAERIAEDMGIVL